jgi:hypothetical protein
MAQLRNSKQFAAVLNTQRQSIKQINDLVARAAGLAGCEGCGRIAYLDLHFHDDPLAEFKDVMVSQRTLGF